MTDIVPLNLSMGVVYSFKDEDGTVQIVFRPAIESLDLNVKTQMDKVKSRSWARTSLRDLRLPGDPRTREWLVVDRKTFTMWLATINENNLAEEKRQVLISYQAEAADALDKYWHEGGAINPRATVEQLDRLDHEVKELQVAKGRAEVLAILRQGGVVDAGYLDACGRRLAGRVLGETPELDPVTRPLTVSTYLEGKGLTSTEIKKIASAFGKALKKLYISLYDEAPPQIDDLVNRHVVSVAQYQERHRPLFDQVYTSLTLSTA